MGRQRRVVGEADPQLSRETDVGAGHKRLTRLSARPLALAAVVIAGSFGLLAAPALAAAPTATTGTASAVTYQSATLTGTVNPGAEPTEVYFQYGATDNYGVQSAPTALPSGTTTVSVSIPITGLTAFTTYHYRIVATNATTITPGHDKSFTTAKIPLSLAITAAPNPVTFGNPVTIEGTLSGTGNAGTAVQLQQSQFPYTAGFADVGNAELTLSTGTFVFNVLGLALNTEYRVVSGTTVSATVAVANSVSVALSAKATGTKKRPTVHFSGTIAPAEPSARIAFERLIGTSWKVVCGTVAVAVVSNGTVGFSSTVRVFHSGFFRALVLPVEGAHVSGYSQTVVIKLK